jgi:GNAT superfamily N-acetyltransferase
LQYRRATPKDIPAMAKIRLSVKENVLADPTKVTLQMYEDYLHLLGRGWVCCRGHEIVGFAYASRDDASIWALFIKPFHEGRGIGRRLMSFAVNWLFALGHPSITLYTGSGTRADRFYGKSGWVREGVDGKNNAAFRKYAPGAHSGTRS